MTTLKNLLKPLTTLTLCAVACASTYAQKLPAVQQKSLRAPATIKVDGKATEWDDSFQAYNHATDIFYSMANDDKNLYLVVQATDNKIINKIIGGGVTLTIQKSGKKDDKNGITIGYPVFDSKDRPYVRGGGGGAVAVGSMRTFGSAGGGAPTMDIQKVDAGPAAKLEGDSVMMAYNKRLDEKSKNILVLGIPGLDTLISVYNEDGIKTAQRFNTKMAYTYELAIDLKKLGLSASDASKFAYHIKLNGAPMGAMNIQINGASTTTDPALAEKMQAMISQMRSANGMDPTDFWGEYALAKNE